MKSHEKIEYYIDNYRKTHDSQYLKKIQKSYQEENFQKGFPSIHDKQFKNHLYKKKNLNHMIMHLHQDLRSAPPQKIFN